MKTSFYFHSFSGEILLSPIDFQAGRVRAVVADGVKEIWLSSEDTGAYGMEHHFLCF